MAIESIIILDALNSQMTINYATRSNRLFPEIDSSKATKLNITMQTWKCGHL